MRRHRHPSLKYGRAASDNRGMELRARRVVCLAMLASFFGVALSIAVVLA